MKLFVCLFAFVATTMGSNYVPLDVTNEVITAAMLQEAIKLNPGQNTVISGFSVLNLLAQLTLASVGEPHEELLNVIGFPTDTSVMDAFSELWKHVKSIKGVQLDLAYKLFVRKRDALNEGFATMSRNVFNTDVQNVDFSKKEAAADEINEWFKDNKHYVLNGIIAPNMLDSSTGAVLASVFSFQGMWKNIFDWKFTKERDFYKSKDNIIKYLSMQRLGIYDYAESAELDAKIVDVPYNDSKSSLIVVLPNQIDGINSLVEKLADPLAFSMAAKKLSPKNVLLQLPKFQVEAITDLKEIFSRMNIKKTFSTGQARLDNLLQMPSDLAVDIAIQRMSFDIFENGSGMVSPGYGYGKDKNLLQGEITKNFIADRPFYFALKVDDTVVCNGIVIAEFAYVLN